MEGEIYRKNLSEVIEYPENYEDMKKKYLERQKDLLEKVLIRRKAESEQALRPIASSAIANRANRAASEHKPLKDRSIIREAKSEDIQDLKRKLNLEINAIGQRILNELKEEIPTLEKKVVGLSQLKGRVSQNPQKSQEYND